MLEGLPPNNAAHRLTLVSDEKRARAVADLIVESFEPAEPRRPPSRPRSVARRRQGVAGRGLFWLRARRGRLSRADRGRRRRGDRARCDLRRHREARLGRQCAGRPSAGARRAVSGPWAPRPFAGPRQRRRHRDRGGLAFGTGHHGTTRGCLLHFDRLLKRRRPRRVLDVGCGAGVLAIAAAKVLRRKSGSATSIPSRSRSPTPMRSSTASASLQGGRLARRREPDFARRRALRCRLRQHSGPAAQAARTLARGGHGRGRRGDRLRLSFSPTFPVCSPPGGRRAFSSPSGSISRAGRASAAALKPRRDATRSKRGRPSGRLGPHWPRSIGRPDGLVFQRTANRG